MPDPLASLGDSLGDDERLVTLVLCDADGAPLGQLRPVRVRPRYWPETGPVVEAVRARDGLEVRVLRLLTTDGGYAGGPVSYLARLCFGASSLEPVGPALEDAVRSDPTFRQWWAEPHGLDGLDEWVDGCLDAAGRRRTGPLRQRKTWNLSTLVTAPTDEGDVWVKATPPFLADEHGVIARVSRVDATLVPRVLGFDAARRMVLLDHAPGEDQFGLADGALLATMATRLVELQHRLAADTEHLLALGAADLRFSSLRPAAEGLLDRPEVVDRLDDAERAGLERLVAGLPERLAEADACGLPDSLVHNDAHPGNWRWDGARLTLLDWADIGVGNPAMDLRAFTRGVPDEAAAAVARAAWVGRWSELVPGSDPDRAALVLEPVAHLRAATTYLHFLDHIEATERIYHLHDPADQVRAALALADAS